MKRFKFKAKDKKGGLVVGEVEAQSPEQAAKLVRDKGLIVITITPLIQNIFSWVMGFKNRVTSADVANFTRQFATMVNAGVPITEALLILRSQATGPLQKMFSEILADVEGGQPLSAALSKFPDTFSQTYIALIKSGEVGGVMDVVLSKLADNLEKDQEFRGKVKGALIYPAVVVTGMVVVGIVMMVFVIPRLTSLYTEFGADLPGPTKILIGLSNIMMKFWPFLIIGAGFIIYSLGLYRKTPSGKRKIDDLIFKIPIYGQLQRQIILTDLTRTLSLMVGAGVSILEGLQISAGVVGNTVISDALYDTAKQIEKGFPVSYSFARHPDAFPFILSQMMSVGEETGKMDEVLSKVSHVFEVESEQKVKGLTAAIEPLIMIVLGIGVGFLVIAIILPIYNLTSQF